jgi:ribonucleotide reductase alpha subunit
MKIPYDSVEARQLNKEIFETIYHGAIEASMEIAKKRKEWYNNSSYNKEYTEKWEIDNTIGENPYIIAEKLKMIPEELEKLTPDYIGAYSSFIGSPVYEGKLQFDLWDQIPDSGRYNWDLLKSQIKENGIRNSLLIAIMPTASSASIMGNNEGVEAFNSMIYKRRVLSGEFILVNKYLRKDLMELNLWNKEISNAIIMNNGSIQNIPEIPDNIKALYKTVWEISQKATIDMAADRGIYVCQSQSMNLFFDKPEYKKLTSALFYGFNRKLKTGSYYIRSNSIAKTQLFTIEPTQKIEEIKEDEVCENCSA